MSCALQKRTAEIWVTKYLSAPRLSLTTFCLAVYYVFHDRVTLFFANNSLTQCRITMKFLHNFFLNSEVIYCSQFTYYVY